MLDFLLLLAILLLPVFWVRATKRPKNYPPGPKWYPIVGSQFYLRRKAKKAGGQHFLFDAWRKKYDSPVIGMKLGQELVVVATTYPIIREVYTSDVFNGRPDNFFFRQRSMGTRLGITSADGDLWIEQRNFVMKHLRRAGFGRPAMEEQMQIELEELLEIIDEKSARGEAFWPDELLSPSLLNVLWTFTAGYRLDRSSPRLKHLIELLKLRDGAVKCAGGWLSTLPFLRFIAPEMTGYNLVQQFNEELLEFIGELIDEHKMEYTEDKADYDLIFAFIKEMKDGGGSPSNFTDMQLTMIILDLFIAGANSTSVTVDLALMMMILRPDIQQRVHDEIDSVLGKEAYPALKDKSKLLYIDAFLYEIGRFFHITVFSGPRRALRNTQLGKYDIPKDTTVIMALNTVLRDEEYWGDPDVFRPERFIDETGTKIVNTERFVAFGQGRRKCPGEVLARAGLFTMFVGIMQKYRVVLPPGELPPTTKTLPGLILSPKPYRALFVKRG